MDPDLHDFWVVGSDIPTYRILDIGVKFHGLGTIDFYKCNGRIIVECIFPHEEFYYSPIFRKYFPDFFIICYSNTGWLQ